MKRHSAELLLLLITVLWAGTFAVIKTEVTDVLPSVFVVLRFGVASIIGLAIWGKQLWGIDAKTLMRGLVVGSLFGMGFLLQTMGLTSTTASTSAFITGTMVVFVPLVQRVVNGTSLRKDHAVSILLVLIGLALFTSPETGALTIGDVLTLASAILWAVYLTYIDRWTGERDSDPRKQNALVLLQFLVTLAIATLAIGADAAAEKSLHVEVDTSLLIAVGYCGVFATVIPTFVQTRYQRFTHPVRAGVIFALEPIAASVIAWMLISESFSARQIVGAVVLMIAIVLPDIVFYRKNHD